MNLFTSLDPSVKKLLGWKMGDEEEKWALKAVESLVKKMQKRKHHGYGTVEDLEYALSHPGSTSNCVTIPRSLDGRLQVSHRKGLPHVIYCRVWRWPNLQSHQELRSTTDCMFPYDGRSEQICINPYHYHRIVMHGQSKAPHPSSAVVPSSSFAPSSSSSSIGTFSPPPSVPSALSSPSSSFASSSSALSVSSSLPSFRQINNTHHQHHHHLMANAVAGPSASPTAALFTQSPSALSDDDDFVAQQQQRHIATIQQQLYNQQICCWSSVCYYELNSRVGEAFKVLENIVVIDGFTNPSGAGRICLGLLSNVNRNATIENTRRHIGMGIRLMCTENSVLMLNQSDAAVFVQSRNANFKYALQPTAVKQKTIIILR